VVSEQLERDLYRVVAEQPGRTGRYYMFILRERHPGLRRRQVNQILYYSPQFVNRGDLKPAWDVCASREPSFAPSSGGRDWDAFTSEDGNDEPSSAPVRQRPDWRLTAPTGRPVDFQSGIRTRSLCAPGSTRRSMLGTSMAVPASLKQSRDPARQGSPWRPSGTSCVRVATFWS